jgi:hypothetical protein
VGILLRLENYLFFLECEQNNWIEKAPVPDQKKPAGAN